MSVTSELVGIIERQQAELEAERERLAEAVGFINDLRNRLDKELSTALATVRCNQPPQKSTYYFLGRGAAYECCGNLIESWIRGDR